MWNALEFEGLAKFLPLAQPHDNASIVELEELFEHQDSQKLRLGELVRTLGAGILSQGFLTSGDPFNPFFTGNRKHKAFLRSRSLLITTRIASPTPPAGGTVRTAGVPCVPLLMLPL